MPPRPRGRPTDCTPEVTERVCRDLRAGLTVASACHSGGISTSSYCDWRVRGESGEEPFAGFLDATTRAISEGSRSLELVIRKAATVDWRAAHLILKCRHPTEWGNRLEHTGRGGGPIEVKTTTDLTAMTDAELRALAGGGGGNADGG